MRRQPMAPHGLTARARTRTRDDDCQSHEELEASPQREKWLLAIKRRMPQGLARALKRQRSDERSEGERKRRRDQAGDGEGRGGGASL